MLCTFMFVALVMNVGKFLFFCGPVQSGSYKRFEGTFSLFDISCTVIMQICALRLWALICKRRRTVVAKLMNSCVKRGALSFLTPSSLVTNIHTCYFPGIS
jgi:hypothetical protein